MAKFGWCQSNYHDQCKVETERWLYERGRVTYLKDISTCDCKCHPTKE